MAPKALPPAKSKEAPVKKVDPNKLLGSKTKKVDPNKLKRPTGKKKNSLGSGLGVVKTQIIKVENLIKNNFTFQKRATEKKRIRGERTKDQVDEAALEKKDAKADKAGKKISLPKLGFFERIKQFFMNLLMGVIVMKLLPHVGGLGNLAVMMVGAIEWITDFAIGTLDAVASFVDGAYTLLDAAGKWMPFIFGPAGMKGIEILGEGIRKVVGAVTIVATGLAFLAGKFLKWMNPVNWVKAGVKGVWNLVTGGPKKPTTAAMRKYALKHGRKAAVKRFGKDAVKKLGGKFGRSVVTNVARKAAVGALGKSGTKQVLQLAKKFISPVVKKIPFIGALLDFVLNVFVFKEPVGKAAFKAIGAGLGIWIGGIIGTLIPIPFAGSAIGGWLGGMGGDALAGAIYDGIFGNKKPSGSEEPESENKAGGGPTRGGVKMGSISRNLKKSKEVTRTHKPTITELDPGKDIGGKKKLVKLYPDTEEDVEGRKVTVKKGEKEDQNPLGHIEETYEDMSKADFFGPLMAIAYKTLVGDRPGSVDYHNVGLGLNAWLHTEFGSEVMRSKTMGFAEGGEVASNFLGGKDFTKIIEKSVEENIGEGVENAIRKLRKQMGLTPAAERAAAKENAKSLSTTGTGGSTTGGEIGALLDTIAFAEGTAHMPNSGYNTHFGFSQTADLSKHPDKVITSANGKHSSTAFGRYQFLSTTWANVGGGAMTPARQDWGATRLVLMRMKLPQNETGAKQLEKMLQTNGLTGGIADKLAPEWASFPTLATGTSYYGQGGKTLAQVQAEYKKRLKIKSTTTGPDGVTTTTGPDGVTVTTGPGDANAGATMAGDMISKDGVTDAGSSLDVSNIGGKKKIYLHWSAGGYTDFSGLSRYNVMYGKEGDRHVSSRGLTANGHTAYRRDGVGLAAAGMGGALETNFGSYPITNAQMWAMATDAATLAKAMGYSKVTDKQVQTHGEAEIGRAHV